MYGGTPRMRVLLVLLVAGVVQGARVPRQAEGEEGDCEAANDAHAECTTQ